MGKHRKLQPLALVCAVLALLLAASAHAIPQYHSFTLTVAVVTPSAFTPVPASGWGLFGGTVAAGNTYTGGFSVDDAIMGSDGLHTGVPISDFHLQIGDVVWSQNAAPNNVYAGFRDPLIGLAAFAPGLMVSGGELTDLAGGVYGIGDVPYVDFSGYGGVKPNHFIARDLTGVYVSGCLSFGKTGCSVVPEPASWGLLAIGLLSLAAVSRPRRLVQRRIKHLPR